MAGIVTFAVGNAAIDDNGDHEYIKNHTSFMDKFRYIGMNDPFPDKKTGSQPKPSAKDVKLKKDLYPVFKMDNPEKPPTMIYIPTADLMVKMIKACIGVKSVYDILEKF